MSDSPEQEREMAKPIMPLGVIPDALDDMGMVILAAGPLTHQPNSMAFRVVLCIHNLTKYVVWNQYFPDCPTLKRTHMNDGHYFDLDDFPMAAAKFAHTIASDSESYGSLYRRQ